MEYTFKEILQNYLCKNNLTPREFAKKIGVKPSRVKNWLSGARVRCKTLIAIVLALNVSADYFLGLKEDY